jgi:hypothetical protein
MLLLRPDGQLPWRLFGPGAGAPDCTGTTRRVVKTYAHDRPASHIVSRGPFDAGVTLGTPCLLRWPIQDEGIYSIALASALLPALGTKRWTNHIDLMQAWGTGQKFGVDIATVE